MDENMKALKSWIEQNLKNRQEWLEFCTTPESTAITKGQLDAYKNTLRAIEQFDEPGGWAKT